VNGSAADFLLNFRVTKLFYAIFIIYLRIDFYWHGIMLGCMFAHQFLEQCSSGLRASLAANTSIKLAGSVSTADARTLAPDFRTTADFILNQPKLHFACHIRNVTKSAVSLAVPVGTLEREPRLSAKAYHALQSANRARVSILPGVPANGEVPPSPVPLRDPDIAETSASDWR